MAEPDPTVEALNRVADAIEGFNLVLSTLATADVVEASSRKTRRRVVAVGTVLCIGLAMLLYISVGNRRLGDSNRELLQQNSQIITALKSQQDFLDRIEHVVCTAAPEVCTDGHVDPSKVPG